MRYPSPSLLRNATCLAEARSRLGSDSPPDCHSLPRRRFATRLGEAWCVPLKYTTEKLNFFYLHSYMKIFQAKRENCNPKPFPEGRVDFCGAKRRDERYILPYCFSLPPSRQQRLVLFSCFCTAEPPPSSDGGLIGALRFPGLSFTPSPPLRYLVRWRSHLYSPPIRCRAETVKKQSVVFTTDNFYFII